MRHRTAPQGRLLALTDLSIGKQFGPYSVRVTRDFCAKWNASFEPHVTRENDVLGPGAVSALILRVAALAFGQIPDGAILARQSIRWGQPPRVDRDVKSHLAILAIESKSGRPWVTFQVDFRQDESVVALASMTWLWPMETAERDIQ
jgi:hypothetical protein